MAISFDSIPNSILVPGQYYEISNQGANRGLFGMPSRILYIGQKYSSAPAAVETPILVSSAAEAEGYFGRGSMLHRMFIAGKKANSTTETWAIALADDAAGTAATGSLTFGGTLTGSGTVNLYIGGRRVRVSATSVSTGATIATAVVAAITADTLLPVSAAVDGTTAEKVNVTAKHKGECGNTIDLRLNYYQGEASPTGMTCTIVAMASGAGNPDIGDAISVFGDTWWTDVICPYTDSANLAALEDEAAARDAPLVQKDFVSYGAVRGTYSGLNTWASTRNSEYIFVLGVNAPPAPAEEWAASYGAVATKYSSIDQARPLQTLELPAILPPSIAARFTPAERQVLLQNGIGTFIVDDGGTVRLERTISNYVTNAYGVPDSSWRDLETRKTMSWIRYQRRARVASKFPRCKLASDGTRAGAGQALVTPRIIRADGIAQFRQWEDVGMVENVDSWVDGYIVERDAEDQNRINELIPPDVVNQLRVIAGRIQLQL